MDRMYKLDGHKVVRCENPLEWAHWFETADRCVKLTVQGDVWVSTVFLGLDQRWSEEGPPVVFETMAFTPGSGDQEQYCTWEEAEEGHDRMVMQIFKPTPILALPEVEK